MPSRRSTGVPRHLAIYSVEPRGSVHDNEKTGARVDQIPSLRSVGAITTAEPPINMMPASFLGHGNPMNAPASNGYTEAWRRIGRELPCCRCIG